MQSERHTLRDRLTDRERDRDRDREQKSQYRIKINKLHHTLTRLMIIDLAYFAQVSSSGVNLINVVDSVWFVARD